jgi:hypothetical protein
VAKRTQTEQPSASLCFNDDVHDRIDGYELRSRSAKAGHVGLPNWAVIHATAAQAVKEHIAMSGNVAVHALRQTLEDAARVLSSLGIR